MKYNRKQYMSKAKEFEKQIARIYKVLTDDFAEVTWNDKIPDPDNPKQLRQIDITIKRNNEITHIECRSHNVPQNTKWIEELYGRKVSLQATSMIAVSDSCFTKGAIQKAKKLGIFLCKLSKLSEIEIKNWGKKSRIKLYYYALSNISFCFAFHSIKRIKTKDVAAELNSKPEYIDALFNELKYRFNSQRDFHFPYCFRLLAEAHKLELCGKKVKSASVQGEVNEIIYEFECPFVYEYCTAGECLDTSIANIEKAGDMDIEIIKTQNGLVSICFDISSAPQAPVNSILAGIVEFQEIPSRKDKPPHFSVIGSPEQKVYLNEASFSIIEHKNLNMR